MQGLRDRGTYVPSLYAKLKEEKKKSEEAESVAAGETEG
jgi:hypothetical protein